MHFLSTAEVCEACGGIKPKQLRAWVARGLVAPAWHTERGFYLWRYEQALDIREVRDAYLARLDRLGAAAGRKAA